jgi:molecular chaperone DnaK
MFPETEATSASNVGADFSVPSFNLDSSSLFGEEAPATQHTLSTKDLSVPSFKVDVGDLFGSLNDIGSSTHVAQSPFDLPPKKPSVPEVQRVAGPPIATFDPLVVPSTPVLKPPAPPRGYVAPASPESQQLKPVTLDDEDALAPYELEEAVVAPVVVPTATVRAVAPAPRQQPPAVSPLAATLQAGTASSTPNDMFKPGLPPGRAANVKVSPASPPLTFDEPAPPPKPLSSPPPGGIPVPLLLDVTPLSLGVETAGGQCESVIRRNATIPVEQTRIFATTHDEQTSVVIRISQGESRRFADNQPLGELELSNLRQAARGEVSIAVTFELGADGTLTVKAQDVETGRETATRVSLLTLPTEAAQSEMVARQQTKTAMAAT